MQPIFLDGISVAFPELKIIGAHLGYGLYDSAAAVARWRRNVYFDISGGTVVRRHLIERNMLRSEVSTLKLVWGSDCDMAHMSRELSAWMQAFDESVSGGGTGPDLLGHGRAHLRRRRDLSYVRESRTIGDQGGRGSTRAPNRSACPGLATRLPGGVGRRPSVARFAPELGGWLGCVPGDARARGPDACTGRRSRTCWSSSRRC